MEELHAEGLANPRRPRVMRCVLARGVVKRWQGYAQAGLLSREKQKTGVPTLC